jgi:hypothetical protein
MQLYLRVYPSFKKFFMALAFMLQVAYAFSLTELPSPILYLARVRLRLNNQNQLSKSEEKR